MFSRQARERSINQFSTHLLTGAMEREYERLIGHA